MRIPILGVRIDNLSKKELLEKVESFLSEPKFHQIATVGPEFILEAGENEKFKNILNNCALNVADGVGVWFAFLRYGKYLKARIAGADLMLDILELADKNKLNIFLACRKDGLSTFEETREAISRIYPGLKISGRNIDIGSSDKLPVASDSVLFCNFGAPHQEFFINSVKSDTIRLAMGVGGSFDFLTGKTRRAPLFLRRLGLEWLWRLFQLQPWEFKKERIKRIFRAAVVFPIRITLNK